MLHGRRRSKDLDEIYLMPIQATNLGDILQNEKKEQDDEVEYFVATLLKVNGKYEESTWVSNNRPFHRVILPSPNQRTEFSWNANVCSLQWPGKTTDNGDYSKLNVSRSFISIPRKRMILWVSIVGGVGFPFRLHRMWFGSEDSPWKHLVLRQKNSGNWRCQFRLWMDNNTPSSLLNPLTGLYTPLPRGKYIL